MWVIVAIAIIATIILLTGKGSMLVSGFNTKNPEAVSYTHLTLPTIRLV